MDWDLEADLVIVGAGLAGYCAALEAAESNARVLLLEKMRDVGGTSGMSGGLFAFAGTDLQRERGIDDGEERLYDDLRKVGNCANDDALVRIYVKHQLDTYHWLRNKRVQFGPPEASGGQSVPRSHTTNSAAVIQTLAACARDAGAITCMTETPARRLVRDAGGERVSGVLAMREGREIAIRAKRGVILAAGGFSRNQKLLECFAPLQVGVNTVCGKGSTGDGLLMAWKVGAGLRDMAYIKSTFGNHPDAGSERHRILFPVYRGAVAVNRHGRRFVNESLSYKALGDVCAMQPGAIAYQIFDQTVMDQSSPGVVTFDFEEALQTGYLLTAETVADLAHKIDIDPQTLGDTIERYNGNIARGVADELGRATLSNAFGSLVKLERPPYYASPSVNVMLGTYCGITIDARAQVLDVFDQPIAGLYAAGEIHGGFHGAAYMTGSGLGKAAVFGRLAAAEALRS